MPRDIVKRAASVLRQLETANRHSVAEKAGMAETGSEAATKGPKPARANTAAIDSAPMQMTFFQLDDPVLTQIRDEILNLDIDNLSPLQALNKLSDIRSILTGK